MHNLGIIGFGSMAGYYHYNTVKREDVNMPVTAVFDVRPEARENAAKLGLKAYDNAADFFADGSFDLVLVATSNNQHCRSACMAMEAGYPVIVEKPAALNAREVERMIDVSEKTGRFFTVHQNRRWDADFRLMMKAVKEGGIGEITSIESHCQMPDNPGCIYNWRGMRDHGGGMLMDWGVHMIDQLLWYVGKPVKSVYAVIRSIRSAEVDDCAKLLLTFDGGLTAEMEVSTFSPLIMPRWMVYGTQGSVRVEDFESESAKVRRIQSGHWDEHPGIAYGETDFTVRTQNIYRVDQFEELEIARDPGERLWPNIYKNLRDVLDGKDELFVKPQEVLASMRVLDAAFESAEKNEVIRLN